MSCSQPPRECWPARFPCIRRTICTSACMNVRASKRGLQYHSAVPPYLRTVLYKCPRTHFHAMSLAWLAGGGADAGPSGVFAHAQLQRAAEGDAWRVGADMGIVQWPEHAAWGVSDPVFLGLMTWEVGLAGKSLRCYGLGRLGDPAASFLVVARSHDHQRSGLVSRADLHRPRFDARARRGHQNPVA